MKLTPLPFQETGINFLISRKRALLSDEMGVGKSVQALHAIERVKAKNVLIICPASLVLMWQAQIKNHFGQGVQVIQPRAQKSEVELSGRVSFVIVSHNYIQKNIGTDRLLKVSWDVILNDEVHACKNWTSKTCKGFVRLASVCKGFVWMLTGTPASKSGQDYYPYLEICEPGKWGSFWAFSNNYCNVAINYFSGGREFKGVRENLKPVLRDAFRRIMMRRLKKDVLPELPDKFISRLPVAVDSEVVAQSLRLDKDQVARRVKSGLGLDAHIMQVCRSIGLGKVDAGVEYIDNCEEPIVVFCNHTDVAALIAEKIGKESVLYTGQESSSQKETAVRRFQSGDVKVIILNARAGGTGITLHASSHVLFVELPWSPAVLLQASDRVHRIGQKSCVNIVHMVADGTIDEDICAVLSEKETFMKQVMGDVSC